MNRYLGYIACVLRRTPVDNRTIDFTGQGRRDLEAALRLMWGEPDKGGVQHYTVISKEPRRGSEPVPTLVLLRWSEGSCQSLPFRMDLEETIVFVNGWLNQKGLDYGQQPSHDGNSKKGFRMFTEDWGHVNKLTAAFVAIQPAWAVYGK